MQVQSLGEEDPLEEDMATTPVFLPGESHGQRSLGGATPHRIAQSYMTEAAQHAQTKSSIPSLTLQGRCTCSFLWDPLCVIHIAVIQLFKLTTVHLCAFMFSPQEQKQIIHFHFFCLFFPRRSPEEGNGNPLQYSYLENSVDRGAWLATVHGVKNS